MFTPLNLKLDSEEWRPCQGKNIEINPLICIPRKHERVEAINNHCIHNLNRSTNRNTTNICDRNVLKYNEREKIGNLYYEHTSKSFTIIIN